MNCTLAREILPLYIDAELVPVLTDDLARHLARCADCRSLLDLDRKLAASLSTLALPMEDARLPARRMRIWTGIEQKRPWDRSHSGPSPLARVASTSVGLLAIGVMLLLLVALGRPLLSLRAAPTRAPFAPDHLFLANPTAADGYVRMLPVDPRTLADLPGYPSLNFGHDFASALSPDGRTLAAFVAPSGAPLGARTLHLVDLTSGTDWVPGVKIDGYPDALTFSSDDRSLYWIGPIFLGAVQNWPDSLALDRYDLASGALRQIATLPSTLVTWDARILPSDTLAVFEVPTNSGNMATDFPHLLLVNLNTGQITADVRLDGVKIGQYPDPDLSPGQVGSRTYRPGLAWDLPDQLLYVASPETDRIVVVDLARGRIVRSSDIHPPGSILGRLVRWLFPSAEAKSSPGTTRIAELSPDGRRLYLVGTREGKTWSSTGLDVVDLSDFSMMAHLDLPVSDLALSPDGQRLLLHLWWPATPGNPEHQALAILDAQRLTEQGRIPIDSPFDLIGFSPDGRDAYVSRNVQRPDQTWETRISVVDVASRRIVAERGFSAKGIAVYADLVGVWRDGAWR